jgi:hypothetical protein
MPPEDLIMADTKVEEKTCLIPTFERNRYFFGKPMTVRDFDAEQQYMIGKSKLQNRLIHGSGIICGMVPSQATITGSKLTVFLTEGAAIDCCGNLIVVNKSDTVEVQAEGTLIDGPHYFYVRFSECVRQPIMASANVSSCEEVCCYNRIRETFEVFLSSEAPAAAATAAFTGIVKNNKAQPIVGARVRASQDGAVQAETLTDISGKFSLGVAAGIPFNVTASATGFAAATIRDETITLGQTEKKLDDFVLTAQAGTAPANVCMNVTQDYFDSHSKSCRRCDDPKVFLAVANISGAKVTIDPASIETRSDRAVVYTNPMLHDLLCDHISDFNNPHRTTASQVKALQNVNGVGNSDDKADVVARIDIVSDAGDTIKIENHPETNKIKLKGPPAATQMPKSVSGAPVLGTSPSFALEDHVHTLEDKVVARKHLSDDVFSNLVFSSDSSITVAQKATTDISQRQINLTTKVPPLPGAQTTQVSLNASAGASEKYARENHVHDLADRVVTNTKLADEIITRLVTGDGTITVNGDLTSTPRQIKLTANPAREVKSVGPEKKVGESPRFAREDHVHDLRINDQAPDGDGKFRLSVKGNLKIEGGQSNEVIISTTADQTATAKPFQVITGLVRFEGVRVGEPRTSPPITPGIGFNFAVVLGALMKEDLVIGELSSFDRSNPLLEARYTPGTDFFVIDLRDTRPTSEQTALSYVVRWWAIPFTSEIEPVVSLPK